MSMSAGFMGLLGLGTSLFPRAILAEVSSQPSSFSVLLASVMGALYLGFALLNWMARTNLIGGIYSRPVAIGNFAHFFAATIVLTKRLITAPTGGVLIVVTVAYGLFAAGFGYVAVAGGQSCS